MSKSKKSKELKLLESISSKLTTFMFIGFILMLVFTIAIKHSQDITFYINDVNLEEIDKVCKSTHITKRYNSNEWSIYQIDDVVCKDFDLYDSSNAGGCYIPLSRCISDR